MGYSNQTRHCTENIDKVQEQFESMSESFTYRQEKYKNNRSHGDIIFFERELDFSDIINTEYDLDFNSEDNNCDDVYDSDIIKIEFKDIYSEEDFIDEFIYDNYQN
jgi:hypothetical protein